MEVARLYADNLVQCGESEQNLKSLRVIMGYFGRRFLKTSDAVEMNEGLSGKQLEHISDSRT